MARKKKKFFKKKISGLMQRKLVMLFGVIILAFVFLIGCITYINASKGEKYTKVVLDQQQYNNRTIPFKRGDIVDRNGTKLATSERVYNVVVDAKVITSNKKYMNPTVKVLAKCFGLKKKAIRTQVKKNPNSRYIVLKKGVSYAKAQEFEKITADTKHNPNVQGVWLEEDYTRQYPYKTLASDVIGFTTNGNVGSNGIEASYNSILNGTDGREYGYLDESSGFERTVKEPDNGSTVVSTIDLQVQSIVEQHILAFNEEHKDEETEGEGSKNTGVIVISEFNPRRNRVIGDRRQLLVAERAEKQKELFAKISVGDRMEGTVKNVTDFGAFIDLGGVDGLLHISEMSWGRVENPKKVFQVGDKVEVMIKDIHDTKIALSLKFPETNPWANAAEDYAVGTVITGKVARMTDFGAFVELAPGVDALLHVSQISKEHVEKPSDVLKVGQEVEAKVVDFNEEDKKISLSMKALLPEEEADTEEVPTEE